MDNPKDMHELNLDSLEGVTGKFKCIDPACAEFDKIKYNDSVNIV